MEWVDNTRMPRILNPAAIRDAQLIDVDLGDDTFVRARTLDLSMMLLEGELPMPMLTAARQFVEHREPEEQISATDHAAVLKTLRKHALLVVVEPVVVDEDDANPNHMPVTLFTLSQLLAIWNQTAVLPKVGAAAAAEFRVRSDAAAPHALLGREDIRSVPEHVACDDDGPAFRGG